MTKHTRDIRKSGRETTHTLTVTWPIEDPTVPLHDLRAEAIDILRTTAHTRGWTYTTAPTMHVNHGAQPTITATVHVHIQPETTQVAA